MRWFKAYVLASVLHSFSWGLYFAFTRPYIADKLGGGYQALLLLAGAEWGLPALSIVWGILADRYGRRKFVALGISGAIPLFIAPHIDDPYLLVTVLSYASFAWGLAWPSILAPILSSHHSMGRRYSVFMVGSTIGWCLGSSTMGFLYNLAHAYSVFYSAGLAYTAAYILYITFFPRDYRSTNTRNNTTSIRELFELFRLLIFLFTAIALTTFGLELGFNVMSVKLKHDIEELISALGYRNAEDLEYVLYGLLYGGLTTLIGIPARIAAGNIVDKYNPLKIFIAINVSYTLYLWGLTVTQGLVSIILWQVPLYPFYDCASYTSTSRYSPEELKASCTGATLTSQSIGGLMMALTGRAIDALGIAFATTVSTLSFTASSILIFLFLQRVSRDRA